MKTVAEVLKKMKQKDQPPLYYNGGCRLLTEMLHDDMSRTLFRSHNGFEIILENDVISRCLKTTGKLKQDQADMCCVVLHLLVTACKDNDENQKSVFTISSFADDLTQLFLKSSHQEIKEAIVKLVNVFSRSEFGRKTLIQNVGSVSIFVGVFSYLKSSKVKSRDPITALNSLAQEKRFIRDLYDHFDDKILPEIEKLLKSHAKVQQTLLPPCLAFIGTLATETAVRKKMSASKAFWEGCVNILQSKPDESISGTLLGLMMNVSLDAGSALKEMSVAITKETLPFLESDDTDIQERSYGLLGRVIGHNTESHNLLCEANVPQRIIKLLPEAALSVQRPAIKCLTRLTQSDKTARQAVVKYDKNLKVLRNLLSMDDNIVVANTALCIGHCCEDPKVGSNLVDTDIIQQLLAKTDTVNSAIKENCAIAVAKLVTSDKRHMERLHELNGIGILHSCMKYVKVS
ncbi:tetratricopeptide repeat protein 12-like [Ptychodera flava]|uniref:tetratricopeptide repeat protein 12-like n=1 Tax=Ptychodera flava TaxID=63121 RepID=UPI00396A2ECF